MINRYIPENSTPDEKYNAVVYSYTNKDNRPAAIAYIGKQSKAYFHYRFMSDEQRAEHIAKFFENMKGQYEFKAERKTKRAAAHTLKVGDILDASWGYDQTNIDFFQITEITEHTVTFGKIAQNYVEGSGGFMCEQVTPHRDAFLSDDRYTRRADGNNHVTFAEYKHVHKLHLSLWNGRPMYQSHYA